VALDKYRAKRNFNESPEPAGDAAHASPKGKAARFFCVQKHLASHLHYDFRLEHDGVLLSWAVPKGPSLDPATKRLAMHVEDHPIEYGDFEGVIPSGYGAGIVMLWDRGTWTPESDDVDAALKKGDLKITLDGYKLKGSWVLVRTKGWGGPGGSGGNRSWLLIKHRDEWAGDVDITEFAPLSVKSRGDFADILAQDDPAIWQSHRPAQGGEAGAMFAKIVARAIEMRKGGADSRSDADAGDAGTTAAPRKKAAAKTSGAAAKKAAVKSAAPKRAATKAVAARSSAGRPAKKAPAKKSSAVARKARPRTT
jgi:bifunctional non-homologous end joining protein LigD